MLSYFVYIIIFHNIMFDFLIQIILFFQFEKLIQYQNQIIQNRKSATIIFLYHFSMHLNNLIQFIFKSLTEIFNTKYYHPSFQFNAIISKNFRFKFRPIKFRRSSVIKRFKNPGPNFSQRNFFKIIRIMFYLEFLNSFEI